MFSFLSSGIFPCSSYHFGCHAAVSLALLEFQHLEKNFEISGDAKTDSLLASKVCCLVHEVVNYATAKQNSICDVSWCCYVPGNHRRCVCALAAAAAAANLLCKSLHQGKDVKITAFNKTFS
jgi:hypothetical protein